MSSYKQETMKQWNNTPCGTGEYLQEFKEGSLEYFDAIRSNRYTVDKWMTKTIDYGIARNKLLLEIGYGIGSDLLTFAENGAEVHGVDLTRKHYDLATANFELHGRKAVLHLCDASRIPYPDNYFDVVYSHGVLHHTPDTVRCISEAYRVLKNGGTFILSLYHKHSLFHFGLVAVHGLLFGKLKKLGYDGLMATIENGADGITIKPLVKTYSRKQLSHILEDFSKVDFKVAHLGSKKLQNICRYIPDTIMSWLGSYLGWYIVAFAEK